MAIKAIINNTEKEIEQIKNSDEQDVDYVYSRIGDTEVEGEPSISIKSIGGNLADYRIYGQTVDGESVGDRTGNLFDGSFIHRAVIGATVGGDSPNRRSIVVDISSYSDGDKITFSRETSVGSVLQMYQVTSPLEGGSLLNSNVFSGNSETLLATITLDDISNYPYLMIFLNGALNPIVDETLLASKIMVNVGNTPLPYEPYGYKVPVTVEGKNLVTSYLVELNGGIQYHPVVFAEVNLQPNTEYLITFTVHENGVKLYSNDLLFTSVYYSSEIQGKKTMRLKTKTSIRSDQHKNNKGWVLLRNAKQNPSDFTITDVKLQLVSDALIYLPEQIKKVGDEAEYISYADQKLHRVGADDIDVTLPALSTIKGTNTLSVNTTIQPSNIYVKDNFDYKKVFTATRTIEDELPLNYRNIEDNDSTLDNYRIYGNTETKTRSYSGTAPLSFPITDGAVSNYRVYGNTVNSESVGDKTENLFDKTKTNRQYNAARNADGSMNYSTTVSSYFDYYIPVKPNTNYVAKGTKDISSRSSRTPSRMYFFDADKNWLGRTDLYISDVPPLDYIVFTTPANCFFTQIQEDTSRTIDTDTFMIVEGSTVPKNYIPYGYRIPITNNAETANIYLDALLTKQGNNADYIDYAEQKRYNADGTSEDVSLPALPAQSSTNSLSVGTTIQPSSVAVDVDEILSCGDRTGNLFDYTKTNRQVHTARSEDGTINTSTTSSNYFEYYIPVTPNATYTVKANANCPTRIYFFNAQKQWLNRSYLVLPPLPNHMTFNTPIDCYFIQFQESEVDCMDETTIILVEGSTALSYEPYGYKIPVTITAGSAETTDIYLDTPLAKSGNNADYIDYATQKRHNSDGTESSITLPAISTLAGTNTLTVGTEVQPSYVEIKGHIK